VVGGSAFFFFTFRGVYKYQPEAPVLKLRFSNSTCKNPDQTAASINEYRLSDLQIRRDSGKSATSKSASEGAADYALPRRLRVRVCFEIRPRTQWMEQSGGRIG
jgi:hypothetical protein